MHHSSSLATFIGLTLVSSVLLLAATVAILGGVAFATDIKRWIGAALLWPVRVSDTLWTSAIVFFFCIPGLVAMVFYPTPESSPSWALILVIGSVSIAIAVIAIFSTYVIACMMAQLWRKLRK